MKFEKDDPLYYREEMKKLLKKAHDNGIEVELYKGMMGEDYFLGFRHPQSKETASCNLGQIPSSKKENGVS